MNEKIIQPNDIVKHIPTGEELTVYGVNYAEGKLIPCGYPFSKTVNISDCEIIEKRYQYKPQEKEQIEALQKEGLTNYIDVMSAMFHGII